MVVINKGVKDLIYVCNSTILINSYRTNPVNSHAMHDHAIGPWICLICQTYIMMFF